VQRPEWTDVQCGRNHSLTLRMIGDSIIHSKPTGHVTMAGLQKALPLIDEAVSEIVGEGNSYVHIADYSTLQGATQEARRAYIDYVKSREGLVGIVFCGVPPLFKLTIQIASRLNMVKGKTAIVDTVEEAIHRARDMLRLHQRRSRERKVESYLQARDDILPAPDAIRRPEWRLDMDGFSLQFEVIDGHIAHGVAQGYLGEKHVGQTFEMNSRVARFISLSDKPPCGVVDVGGLNGVTINGRRAFVRAFRDFQDSTPIKLVVFYRANALLRGALAIWRPMLPLPMYTTKDLDSALGVVRREEQDQPVPKRKWFGGKWLRKKKVRSAESHIDDLLRFLGGIDWEHNGIEPAQQPKSTDSPLSPVYDAVTLLKSELDQQLWERRTAESALRESEERYRTIVDDIVDGYYEIDLEGNMTFCNDAMLRILGYERVELPRLTSRAYMDEEHVRRVQATFKRVFELGRPAKSLDWELIRKDGERIAVEASVAPIHGTDGSPTGFRGIVRDVTERVRAARDREQLEAQLRQAQRMEAVGTLAGGIAHNFNNLLMGIQGNTSMMRRQTDSRHPHHERLKTIESLVQTGSKMTGQLLGYARAGRYEVRPIDLNQLVRQTAETFALARKEIRIHQDLSENTPPIRADRAQIEQALLNLFVNAAEAMSSGGDLYLSSSVTTHESLVDKPYEPKPGSYVCLEIRDAGVGMDEETLERIFEPFFTTKGLSGGTGLGLASVYGTLKAHGGYIDVASEGGAGSTFSLYFPATEEAVDATRETGKILLGKGTVLVVDDDEAVLEACASILEYLRYTPIRAANGNDAVELFTQRCREIDLVILDMILPDMGGGDVFDLLKEIDPSAKVLLASGYSLEGQAERIIERGCDDFIQKPFTIEQLSQKIGSVMGGA